MTLRDPKKGLLVVGSVAFDNVRTPAGSVRRVLGGSAVYFSAAARFFSRVKMVAVVGTDFRAPMLQSLRNLGIDTDGIHFQKGKTFRWTGFYEKDLNEAHTVKTELNVFSDFRPVLSAADRSTRHLFLANIDPELQLAVLTQMQKPRWVACDTMNYWIENARSALLRVLRRVDIVFMNDAEIRQLSGHHHLLRASRWLLRLGPKMAIVKKGEHGSLCLWNGRVLFYPAYLADTLRDPTGAGDTFAGGFLGCLARSSRLTERIIKNAIVHGTVLASFDVEEFGPQRLFRLRHREIQDRYRLYKRMISLD